MKVMSLVTCFFAMICLIIVATLIASSRGTKQVYTKSSFNQHSISPDLAEFIDDLSTYPEYINDKLQMDDIQENFEDNWKSKIYGGSVLDSINLIEY